MPTASGSLIHDEQMEFDALLRRYIRLRVEWGSEATQTLDALRSAGNYIGRMRENVAPSAQVLLRSSLQARINAIKSELVWPITLWLEQTLGHGEQLVEHMDGIEPEPSEDLVQVSTAASLRFSFSTPPGAVALDEVALERLFPSGRSEEGDQTQTPSVLGVARDLWRTLLLLHHFEEDWDRPWPTTLADEWFSQLNRARSQADMLSIPDPASPPGALNEGPAYLLGFLSARLQEGRDPDRGDLQMFGQLLEHFIQVRPPGDSVYTEDPRQDLPSELRVPTVEEVEHRRIQAVRDQLAASAPPVPSWFAPKVGPRPVPSDVYPFLHLVSGPELRERVMDALQDPLELGDLIMYNRVDLGPFMTAIGEVYSRYKLEKSQWDGEFVRQQMFQWPYYYADQVLQLQKSKPGPTGQIRALDLYEAQP